MGTAVDVANKEANGSLLTDKKVTVVFVLGGPGSGKGTQCANIVQHFGYTHLSAGDLLRAEIKSGSENGTMIQDMINEGKIVPSEVTIKLLQKAMEENDNDKFLIDGFPRNEENRAAFELVTGIEPTFVLFFDCPEEEMEKRLLGRNQGREDDNIETIRKRFKVYMESSLPVIEYYNSKGKVRKIDAAKPVEEVFATTQRPPHRHGHGHRHCYRHHNWTEAPTWPPADKSTSADICLLHIINSTRISEIGPFGSMADSGEPQQQKQQEVCSFFKRPSKGRNIRKRPALEEDNGDEDSKDESSVIYNKKKPAAADNKLHFSTGSSKRSVDTETDVESQSPFFQFESSKEIQVQNDNRATATLETETEFSRDARSIRERVLKQAEEALKGKSTSTNDEKLYKGIHGYTDYKAGFRREHTVAGEKAGGAHGPLRASAHIRVSARFDYQPDICKDYKETGYCGYGDACKFMHDRGDYKSGWQLEKEWDEAEKMRKRNLALGVEDEDEDEDEGDAEKSDEDEDDSLPFACFICRQPFVDPVVTKCKHYFCEHCALKHHAKNKKCFVCNQPTLGIFNTAFEIRKKMSAEGK